jgi:hypothetical protein
MCVECGCNKIRIGTTNNDKSTGRPDLPGGGYSGVGGRPMPKGKGK